MTKLALLNTLVYPEFSEAVMLFIKACTQPELREQLTSPQGLEAAMRLGVADQSKLTDEVMEAVREPFQTQCRGWRWPTQGSGSTGGLRRDRAAAALGRVPVRVIYGEQDQILPDIAETMARVKRTCRSRVTAAGLRPLPSGGGPEEIGAQLAGFFAA